MDDCNASQAPMEQNLKISKGPERSESTRITIEGALDAFDIFFILVQIFLLM